MLGLTLSNITPWLARVGLLALLLGGAYFAIVTKERAKCDLRHAQQQVTEVKENEQLRKEVTGLSDTDTRKRLARWVRE